MLDALLLTACQVGEEQPGAFLPQSIHSRAGRRRMQLERLWGGSGRTGGLTKGAVLQPQGKAATLSPHTHALEAALRAPWEVLPVGCTLTWQERALSHART